MITAFMENVRKIRDVQKRYAFLEGPIDLDFQHYGWLQNYFKGVTPLWNNLMCLCPLYYRLIMVHGTNLYQLNEPIVFFLLAACVYIYIYTGNYNTQRF